jgi:acyl-CoA synthetase (AMP-forming)/AMP-acid ligase II
MARPQRGAFLLPWWQLVGKTPGICPPLDAGAIGIPDTFSGEVPQAYVVLQRDCPPVTGSQLIDFVRSRLPGYKVPAQIIFTESLPHGPTGKIDRKTLREKALAPE